VELTEALPGDATRTRLRTLAAALIRILTSSPVAYAAIGALQLKVVWGMWWVKDLTSGDSSEYFLRGYRWYEKGANVISWSPLYTTFYGSLLFLSRDAYVVTVAHRLVIVFALALLVLTLMRRLLAPWAAWLVTAWWVVLPINFDTLYEVHLFVVVPLVAALVLLTRPGPWRRGIALAAFLATTLLMRNEFLMATAGLAALCTATEAYSRWREGRWNVVPYLLPLLAVAVLVGLFYATSSVKYPQLAAALRRKHTLNVCQIVAFGYQQRHPEWTPSPWTDCQVLMAHLFGRSELSLGEAIRANPSAIWDHVRWNARLVPAGFQLLLFNEVSGTQSPDYAPVRLGSSTAGRLTAAWLSLLALAMLVQVRERAYWWTYRIRPRRWAWAGLGLLAATASFVMLMQRPRPSYLFPLSLGLMASTGLALQMVVRRWGLAKWMRWLVPLPVVALLLVVVPTYASRKPSSPRPLMESYRRILPFVDSIRARDGIVVTSGFPNELCNYFALGPRCRDYYALRAEVEAGSTWTNVLRDHRVVFVYLSESALSDPSGQALSTVAGPVSRIASGTTEQGPWTIHIMALSK
jgi:hypothetical protein